MGALGSLLGPLGVVLGRSWRLLGRSWAILGRSWGILRRSWVALGGSWAGLGGSWLGPGRSWGAKRARRAAGQGAMRTRGAKSQPPPSEISNLPPHPSRQFHYFPGPGERGKEDIWNMEGIVEHEPEPSRKPREPEPSRKTGDQGPWRRSSERCPARPEAQGAGGYS